MLILFSRHIYLLDVISRGGKKKSLNFRNINFFLLNFHNMAVLAFLVVIKIAYRDGDYLCMIN